MAELKVYNEAPSNGDLVITAELKRFSKEAPAGPSGSRDHAEEVMDRAAVEVVRRTKNLMIYTNLDYFEASHRIAQLDPDLAELYGRGYIKE